MPQFGHIGNIHDLGEVYAVWKMWNSRAAINYGIPLDPSFSRHGFGIHFYLH